MMGGAWFQEVFGSPEAVTKECLLARATEAVHSHLGVTTAPSWSWVALQRDCIPQYYQGHFRRVESMRSFIKKNHLSLSLIGSSYDGVSVNDVIFSGRTAVEELLGPAVWWSWSTLEHYTKWISCCYICVCGQDSLSLLYELVGNSAVTNITLQRSAVVLWTA